MTRKQKRFCEEYLIDLNATHAAIRAGYSAKSAADSGSDNLQNPEIAAEIDRMMAERSQQTGVLAARVLKELSEIAFCNPLDVIDPESGAVLDREKASAIATIKIREIPSRDGGCTVEREFRMADKIKALELCGKHVGMFRDKVDVSGADGGTIRVELTGELSDYAK